MPPKQQASKGGKKDTSKKPTKPKEGGGKAKKKKWSKGKVRDKLNNMVLFDKPTFDKLIKDVPQIKMISPSVVSERLKIRTSLARHALEELCRRGMAQNADTVLETNRLVLVPYLLEYVTKYHNWMSHSDLRESTCSNLLTLEEEFEAQTKWINSVDRCTFILLHKQLYTMAKLKLMENDRVGFDSNIEAEVEAMIGDVNIFFSRYVDENGDGDESDNSFEGELSVMIAEPKVRGLGLAGEALAAILEYVGRNSSFNLKSICAKVISTNQSSVNFFEKRLHFVERKRNDIFNEIEFGPPESVDRSPNYALNTARFIVNRLQVMFNPLEDCEWIYREFNLDKWRTTVAFK